MSAVSAVQEKLKNNEENYTINLSHQHTVANIKSDPINISVHIIVFQWRLRWLYCLLLLLLLVNPPPYWRQHVMQWHLKNPHARAAPLGRKYAGSTKTVSTNSLHSAPRHPLQVSFGINKKWDFHFGVEVYYFF